jgi:hypothetical protein
VKARILAVIAALATLVAVPACWAVLGHRPAVPHPAASPATSRPPAVSAPAATPARYVGIVTDNLTAFDRTCRCRPNIAVHYLHVGGPQDMYLARIMLDDDAIPLLELQPFGIPLASIVAGQADPWLTRYAEAVKALNAPVLMSFAPEANGDWYQWGYGHTSPALFQRAWRHVVTLFRRADARNAKWVWVVNYLFSHSGPLRRLWPGQKFVDMVGIDGYYERRNVNFTNRFVVTIGTVRALAPVPILITETAAGPRAGKLRAVRQLIAGIKRYRLAGFIWFDIAQHGGITRQDWRLEDDPAAFAAFRQAVGGLAAYATAITPLPPLSRITPRTA